MENMEIKKMEEIARLSRLHVLDMVTLTKSSHICSCYSIVEILVYLYGSGRISNNNKFLLSKGHASAALYAVLAEYGFFSVDRLKEFASNGSIFMSHINSDVPGVSFSTGSLGHALPVSVGIALSKIDVKDKVYVLLSDGELNEGSNWEALLLSSQLHLSNLIICIDCNKIQGLGYTLNVIDMISLEQKFKSFGCEVLTADGHSYQDIDTTFNQADRLSNLNKPIVIIFNTIKGKGVSFMENKVEWHYKSPNEVEYRLAKQELNNS